MLQKTRLIAYLLLFAVLVASFSGCAKAPAPERPLKIDFATTWVEGTPPDKGFVKFVNAVREKTGGAIDIEYHMATIPGSAQEHTDMCIRGELGIANGLLAGSVHVVPQFEMLALPFLFRDADHYYQVVEGPIGDELSAKFEENGLKVLCYYDFGERSLILSKRPVREPKDMKGLKIRAMPVPMIVDMFETLGGSAIAMPPGEMIPALQQGVIDGVEVGLAAAYGSKVHEACKYVSLIRYMITPCALFMNLNLWNSLTNEEQKILLEEAKAGAHYASALNLEFDVYKSFGEAGLEVNEVDREAFSKVLSPLYDKYAPVFGRELIDRIRATGR